jgi:hypothetical protein
VSESSPPSLDGDDSVTLLEKAEVNGILHTPTETLVNVLLPRDSVEVWLLLWEEDWVDAAIEVREAGSLWVSGDHKHWAGWSVLGDETGSVTAKKLVRIITS